MLARAADDSASLSSSVELLNRLSQRRCVARQLGRAARFARCAPHCTVPMADRYFVETPIEGPAGPPARRRGPPSGPRDARQAGRRGHAVRRQRRGVLGAASNASGAPRSSWRDRRAHAVDRESPRAAHAGRGLAQGGSPALAGREGGRAGRGATGAAGDRAQQRSRVGRRARATAPRP